VIGVALLFGAKALYTSPSELPTPPYATVDLETTFPVTGINYTVDQVSPTIAQIKIEVDLPRLYPPAGAPTADLFVLPPSGTIFRTCPSAHFNAAGTATAPYCLRLKLETWVQPLTFRAAHKLGAFYGVAFADLFVKAHNFGVTFNGVTASVAIPQVFLKNASGGPTVYTKYNIPSASSYDWSSFPTQFVNGTSAGWNEQVSGDGLDGRAAVGINHANQAKDNTKTFVAGALLGLAGAALLSGAQEALHAND
jgi:hypothetical protein